MDKKTPPASPPFNHAAQPTDAKEGKSKSTDGTKTKTPKPKLTFEMKNDIGRASRAMSFYSSNSALADSSRNKGTGNDKFGDPQVLHSPKLLEERGGLKETFNPTAKGNDGNDHSR